MRAILIIIGLAVAGFSLEFALHRRSRRRIPIRIHVNGIRGKSSVVRLVAAGLRGGGVRTVAKVTGTFPNIVDEHGNDIPIIRGTPSNIIEQRVVISQAAFRGAEAIVLECMALMPQYQKAEVSLLQPTISVITNVRLDHEEVFGKSILDIALALSNSIPRNGLLATSVGEGASVLQEVGRRRGTTVLQVDAAAYPDSITAGFEYIEHKENVALALTICEQAGVSYDAALAGMRTCKPDIGALRILKLSRHGRTLRFVNALAANDPQSTALLFERLIAGDERCRHLIALVNTRKDRPLRSRQLGQLLPSLESDLNLVIGDDADAVVKHALRGGVRSDRIEVLHAETEHSVVDALFARSEQTTTVFAIGNTAGLGLPLAQLFADHGVPDHDRMGPPSPIAEVSS